MDNISASSVSSIASDKYGNGRIWLGALGVALLAAGLLASASLILATAFRSSISRQ